MYTYISQKMADQLVGHFSRKDFFFELRERLVNNYYQAFVNLRS